MGLTLTSGRPESEDGESTIPVEDILSGTHVQDSAPQGPSLLQTSDSYIHLMKTLELLVLAQLQLLGTPTNRLLCLLLSISSSPHS